MKFNKPNTMKTTNRSGHVAYKMGDKEHLVTAVLTTMFGEKKYYGSTDNNIVKLAEQIAGHDSDFLCRLACYARNVENLRSVSHVLTCVIARHTGEVKRVIKNVVVRPDDITEIMSCYLSMYGKPFPNALKRAIASVMNKFDEYQYAKYNGKCKGLKFRDVLRIVHPKPKDKETEVLFKKIIDGTLETPYTWETELSARGNTAEVWDDLIKSGKLGYMAMLRNLRNICSSGADIKPVLDVISNPERVHKSRQLPFRFYSAYINVIGCVVGDKKNAVHKALETALRASIDNMDHLPGRTLIAIDASGSMSDTISAKSEIRCCDIAFLFGAMASQICEDADVCVFSSKYSWYGNSYRDGYKIVRFGKYDSILSAVQNMVAAAGGTDMSLPFEYALTRDKGLAIHPYDRVIYFSDNEANRQKGTVQQLADKYRNLYNKDLWVHAVDLQGYGTQQFCGRNFNLIAGWSENVLHFISLAEKGIGSLVSTISSYEIDK